jgi:DNA-binding transcriptional LysR family regulator
VGGGPYPAESILGLAAAKFTEQYPDVSVRLVARYWDELLPRLRSRELDFFVAEISTFQQEQDIDVAPMSATHPLFFVGRSAHPLAQKKNVTMADILEWPFVAPSRVPPRVLEPLLHRQRSSLAARGEASFPAIECGDATVKRIIEHSDNVTAFTLTGGNELEPGRYVILHRVGRPA